MTAVEVAEKKARWRAVGFLSLAVLTLTLSALLLAESIRRFLGITGVNVISRVSGIAPSSSSDSWAPCARPN